MLGLVLLLALTGVTPDLPLEQDPLYLSEEAKAFFDERIPRGAPQMDRLHQLINVIFSENGVNFSYAEVTLSAEEVFRRGSGNCLAFTNLIVAAGRYLGLDVRFREVDIIPTWSKLGSLVILNQHVNAVVIIGTGAYVIDLLPGIDRVELRGQLVSDDRGRTHYFNNVGANYLALGDSEHGLATLQKALEWDETAPFVWANLGAALSMANRDQEAEQAYKKAIRLDRESMVAMSNLASLYERNGRSEEAQKLQKKVADFRDKNPYYHYNLGLEAFSSGAIAKSVQHFKDALKRKHEEHRFYFALARAYIELGQMDRAIKALEGAEKYAPDEEGRDRYAQKLQLLAASSQPY